MKTIFASLTLLLAISCFSSSHHDAPRYGPYQNVVPPTPKGINGRLNIVFTGRVFPVTTFKYSVNDPSFKKPNMALSFNCNAVWAYKPVTFSLFDVNARLIDTWIIPPPRLGEPTDGRWQEITIPGNVQPATIVADFPDFAGTCNIAFEASDGPHLSKGASESQGSH